MDSFPVFLPTSNGQERQVGTIDPETKTYSVDVNSIDKLIYKPTQSVSLDSLLWSMVKGTKAALNKKKYPCSTLLVNETNTGDIYSLDIGTAKSYGKPFKAGTKNNFGIPLEFWDITGVDGSVRSGRGILSGSPHRASTGSSVTSLEELEKVVAHYLTLPEFVYDVETYGEHRLDPRRNDVLWIALAGQGCAHTVNMTYQYADGPDCLPGIETWGILEPLLFSETIRKIGHGFKFDLQSIAKYYGAIPPPPYGDTLTLQFLLNENLPEYKLKKLTTRDYDFIYESLAKFRGMETYKYKEAALYTYLDGKYTWLRWKDQFPLLKEEGLSELFDLEMDVLGTVCGMEYSGIPMNEPAMRRMDEDLTVQIAEIEQHIYTQVGEKFDLNSNIQKGRIIYDVLGHEPKLFTKKTKQPSTADDALRMYMSDPVVSRMMDYGDLQKIHSTYILGQMKWLNNGYIHCSFNQCGTVTGRFSATEPNLQNIPARDDPDSLGTGTKIRSLFRAPDGWKIISADFSQLQLRIVAHYANDKFLIDGFLAGFDAHTLTAAAVFGKRPEDVTKDERQIGKNLNFAIVFRAGPPKVASMSRITISSAEKLINQLTSSLSGVENFYNRVIKTCRSRRPPYVRTILGRKRRVPAILSSDYKARSHAERQAFNSIIQGTEADIVKIAMVRVDSALMDYEAYLAIQVHDELVVVCPDSEVQKVTSIMKETMEGINLLRIPLTVSINSGQTWADAK